MLAFVRLQRDSMLLELPVPAIDGAFRRGQPSDSAAVDRALQDLADLSALRGALQTLDDFTFSIVRYSLLLLPPLALLQLP